MKPSLRMLREAYSIKSKVQADPSYRLARDFKRDASLRTWWDEHCRGLKTEMVQPEVQRGLNEGEINPRQAKLVLDFLTSQGYLGPEP